MAEYQCPECGKLYKGNGFLARHMKLVHPVPEQPGSSVAESTPGSSDYSPEQINQPNININELLNSPAEQQIAQQVITQVKEEVAKELRAELSSELTKVGTSIQQTQELVVTKMTEMQNQVSESIKRQITEVAGSIAQQAQEEIEKRFSGGGAGGNNSGLTNIAALLGALRGGGGGDDWITQASKIGVAFQSMFAPLNAIANQSRIETLRMMDLVQRLGPGEAAKKMIGETEKEPPK